MIQAVILAAGQSRRMGQPKMTLPWGTATVLGKVIQIVRAAEIGEILVVTGAGRDVSERICRDEGVRSVFNAGFSEHEMLGSLQSGLKASSPRTEAALVVLGDQPQIQESTIRSVLAKYRETMNSLIVPSVKMRRGHPWLVARTHWDELLEMRDPETPRDFLQRHAADITYVEVETPTILQDLDTPEDYLKMQP